MRLHLIFIFLLLLFLFACTAKVTPQIQINATTVNSTDQHTFEIGTVIVNNNPITVEIARTPSELEHGLMHREYLAENSGMLFIFPQEGSLTFWMKNTLIPLDILFINKEHIIVNVLTMQPCKIEPCETYPSEKPAQYALELPEHFAQNHQISQGDTVQFIDII